MSELTDALLAKPVGPALALTSGEKELTKQIEVKGDRAEITMNTPITGEALVPTDGHDVLVAHGLSVNEWEVEGFRTSEWTMSNGEQGISTRFSFKRKATVDVATRHPVLSELERLAVERYQPQPQKPFDGDHGFIIALGDMQFGKIDGDGAIGTLERTVAYLNKAADLLWTYAQRFPIGHVHIAWLGDHIEGFNSQGGANVWRTNLTLSEQIRLTRRVMLHSLLLFADTAERVSMAAVPGNHGETQRFAGKGVTRYDDSHDTESLIAVSDAASLNPAAFEHVEFYVPETDEMTVTLDVAGTTVSHVHGHQFRPGKHFDWWKGQAFNPDSALGQADLLLAGHLHHEFMESDGKRLFVQVPPMESESTWYRHSQGTGGNPGLIVAVTKDGHTSPLEVVR